MDSHKRKAVDESVGVEKKAKIGRFSDGECIYVEKEDRTRRAYLVVGQLVNDGYNVMSVMRDGTEFNRYMVTGNPVYREIPESAERITNFTLCHETADEKHSGRRWYDSAVQKKGDKSIFDFIFGSGEKKAKPQLIQRVGEGPNERDATPVLVHVCIIRESNGKRKPVEPKPKSPKPQADMKGSDRIGMKEDTKGSDRIGMREDPVSAIQPKRSFNFVRRPGPLSVHQKRDETPKLKPMDDNPTTTEAKEKPKGSVFPRRTFGLVKPQKAIHNTGECRYTFVRNFGIICGKFPCFYSPRSVIRFS